MQHLIKCPDWVFKMFTDLCFSQVQEQSGENLQYQLSNPKAFIYEEEAFVFIHNRSIIVNAPVSAGGEPLKFNPVNN
ncbi:MAG: hypothetical protein ABIS01_07325 [Ferruginibacter sp.]